MGCLTGMRETLAPACALSIPAGAIALGPAPQRDQDRPGTKAPGQRPPRPRRALAFRGAGITGLCESRAQGRRKRKSRFRVPPEHATELSLLLWQGLSPLPQRCAGIRTSPGAKAPGQRPSRPRRALACRYEGGDALFATVPRARGKRDAFPDRARTGESTASASMAGANAPATVPRRDQDQPGAKAPGQRPPRPRRALLARRVGRWPLCLPDLPV